MQSARASASAAVIALLIACGTGSGVTVADPQPKEEQHEPAPVEPDPVARVDSWGNPCPQEPLILLDEAGIPGQYIVVFVAGVPTSDIDSTARALAAKYGGEVRYVWKDALHGFALSMPDANAPLLAAEPVVCYVEQDGLGHIDAL